MIKSIFKIFGVMLLVIFGAMTALGWKGFGSRGENAKNWQVLGSPQWKKSYFENPEPLKNDMMGAFKALLSASQFAAPKGDIDVVKPDPAGLKVNPPSGLRVTWLGHSTTLVEMDGFRILTDPVFSDRTSPYSFMGPKRWYAPLLSLTDLPPIDAVVISHDHYDHLDMKSVIALAEKGVKFIVPVGIAANLAYWGVDSTRITELDWWQETSLERGGEKLRIAMTPARHASGRYLLDNGKKLWAGYALIGARKRVYFSGDTGLFNAMKEIGNKYGPFDLAMIEVGQYHRSWPDWHIGPEQAVKASQWVKARAMLPVHWGLFVLAMHGWTEPMERASAEAEKRKVTLITPRPGESFEPGFFISKRWWPQVPWQTAAEHPIVSGQVDDK